MRSKVRYKIGDKVKVSGTMFDGKIGTIQAILSGGHPFLYRIQFGEYIYALYYASELRKVIDSE